MVRLRSFVALVTVVWIAAGEGAAPARAQGPASSEPQRSTLDVRASLDTYCVRCHSSRLRTAGLSLEGLDVQNAPAHAEIWEKVAAKLRSGAMPPPGNPRPDAKTGAALAGSVERVLDEAAEASPAPGRPAIHRLNRAEYTNVVRDLLAIDVDSRTLLPADDLSFGFDNNADALTFSPGLMDRYLLAARKIARLAVGDLSTRPVVESFPVSRLLTQSDRASEDLPFGTRGGLSVKHQFPVDGEYVLRVRLQGSLATSTDDRIDVRLDGEQLRLFETAKARRDRQAIDAGLPDPPLEVRFAATAGPHRIGVAVVKRTSMAEGTAPSRLPAGNITFRAPGIAAVDLEGPFNVTGIGDTPSRRRIFTCRPARPSEERTCAARILGGLARQAYRRPVGEPDIRTLLTFFESRRSGGFDAAIGAALERMLIDPEFLFRVERAPRRQAAGVPYRLSDLDLASRLSFFLWSSIPDAELLTAAEQGTLRDPVKLEAQVRRMLADARASALVENFAAQWLHVRNLRAVAPDANEFPDFDDDLREAFQRETELFIASQIREDRSVTNLLDADYTFVNERLARHYRLPHVYGSHFRRVTIEGPERYGLLGHGSVLTVTSYATRTSPVVRGKWLLENILGAPPPAPPENVPALKENGEGGRVMSVRERMEEHRKNPVCASCHTQMDPLGFALENFDAIGKWRDRGEDGLPIDASGALPDGTKFDGPAALRRLLWSRRDAFAMTVAEKLLTYALGRGLSPADRPALRRIMRDATATDYRWSSVVLGIVKSTPFQMRTSTP